jgi:hypothetical protein
VRRGGDAWGERRHGPSTADANGIFANGNAVGVLIGVWPSMVMIGEVGLVPGAGARTPKVLSGVVGGGVPSVESDAVESERARVWWWPAPGIAIGAVREAGEGVRAEDIVNVGERERRVGAREREIGGRRAGCESS